MPKSFRDWLKVVVLLAVIGLVGFGVIQRQSIIDWVRLYGYTPPASVVQLADQTTMTAAAKHLFYLNKPEIEGKQKFSQDCPNGSEKTIVLGCYHGGESGIFVLKVSDPRLAGVEQVTAAHEMLHAAYDRLDSKTKKQVDGWLEAYFKTVTDPRLVATFAAYKQSEPDQVVDEMHSVFGTEVAQLPNNLENYYKRYFSDRQKVTAYASDYQSVFVGLKQKLADYDTQLKNLKAQIDADTASARSIDADLQSKQPALNSARGRESAESFNHQVDNYNAEVDNYNSIVKKIRSEVNSYNDLVDKRNTLAVSFNDLNQELDATAQPIKSTGNQ